MTSNIAPVAPRETNTATARRNRNARDKGTVNVKLFGAVMRKTAFALTLIAALIASIISAIGVANAVQVKMVQLSDIKPQFDFEILYAYIQEGTDNSLVYNITHVSDLPSSSEVIIEVYKIEFFSDGHLISSNAAGFYIGDPPMDVIMGLTISLPATHSGISGGGDEPHVSWLRENIIAFEHDFDAEVDLSRTISATVKRLGWIKVDGDLVEKDLSGDEIIQQFKLEEFGDGLLYNVLVPSEEMSQIDLLNPLDSFNPTSPSPSTEPQDGLEPFITMWVAAIILIMAIIGISLLVYFKKRKR